MGDTPASSSTTEFSSSRTERYIGSQSNAEIANTLAVLLLYSVAMFTLPIGAYFGVCHILWYELGVRSFANTFWSVMAAVIVVNVIIASYALRAFREEEKNVPQTIKRD